MGEMLCRSFRSVANERLRRLLRMGVGGLEETGAPAPISVVGEIGALEDCGDSDDERDSDSLSDCGDTNSEDDGLINAEEAAGAAPEVPPHRAQSPLQVVAELLSVVLSPGAEGDLFWLQTLLPAVFEKYGVQQDATFGREAWEAVTESAFPSLEGASKRSPRNRRHLAPLLVGCP